MAKGIHLGAEDVLEKPLNLDVLLAKLRRALQRHAGAATAGISGRLSDLSLVDVLQTLLLASKTAVVRVTGGPEPGAVHVREGRLVAATLGPWEGEDALYALVDVEDGRFDVRFEDTGVVNLRGSSDFLLLEAVRRRDERRGV